MDRVGERLTAISPLFAMSKVLSFSMLCIYKERSCQHVRQPSIYTSKDDWLVAGWPNMVGRRWGVLTVPCFGASCRSMIRPRLK